MMSGQGGSRPPRPNPGCFNLEFGEGAACREIQGAKVRSAESEVANYLRHPEDADDLTGWSDNPDAAGADAKHSTLGVDFHAVGNAGSRRGHITEHAVVAQGPVRGHVERADAPMRTNLATLRLLEAALVEPADRYVQHRLIGRERQPIGVFTLVGGQVHLARRIDAKYAGKSDLAQLCWERSPGSVKKMLPSERHTTSFGLLNRLPCQRSAMAVTVPSASIRVMRR